MCTTGEIGHLGYLRGSDFTLAWDFLSRAVEQTSRRRELLRAWQWCSFREHEGRGE
jgi:hypothetical protein